MGARIYEEVALIIKHKYTVRVIEFKEAGKEFTEISVYSKEVTEKNNDDFSDYFEFCFTVMGKGDEEKEKIEKMNEKEFEEFIRHMTRFIEKKYHLKYKKEEKKEAKKGAKASVQNKVETLSNIVWDLPQQDEELQKDPDIQK
jgi:hypothetical protein